MALATWERQETDALIEEMGEVVDPSSASGWPPPWPIEYEEEERPDVRLLPSASDPVVGEVVRRVQHKRLDFLAGIFRDAGFPPAESRVRARLAYSLALGLHQQRLIDGTDDATPRQRAAYQRRAVEMLMTAARRRVPRAATRAPAVPVCRPRLRPTHLQPYG